jgi:glycosyltransferase involved in cell wall biosynthesis
MHSQEIRKRICFVATMPVTLLAFVRPQAEFLLLNGWDVTWVCAHDSNFTQKVPKGVRYIPMPFRRGIHFFGIPKAIFLLYQLFKREQFDVVQFSTPNAAFYASTAAWLAAIPVRIYAQWGIRYVGFQGAPRQFFKILELWCCRLSTVIEPDSFSNLEFSIKEGLYSKNKSRVIWNGSASGVNLKLFDIDCKEGWRSNFRKKIGLDSHHLVIGFVGSLRDDKGCNELLTACRSFFGDMPHARLLLIGDKYFYNTIDKDLIDWAESSPQVIYVAPNNEIPQYMACMDVFSLPSHREGFGLVIIEAAAMGVPAVVTNIPGPIDAVCSEVTALIVPIKNVDALAMALQSLLNDSKKRFTFGAAAAIYARQNFEQNEYLNYVLMDKEDLFLNNHKAFLR